MTAYVTIPNTDVDAESPVDVDLMTALRDNPIAIAEGSVGAPEILGTALQADSIPVSAVDWSSAPGMNQVIFYNHSSGTSITATSWTDNGTIYIYIPNNVSTIHYRVYAACVTNTCYVRMRVGATNGTTSIYSAGQTGWDTEVETLDVSALAAGWHALNLQGYVDSGGSLNIYQSSFYYG